MPVPYQDHLEATPVSGLSCLVEVERVYRFDWDRFDDHHRRSLGRIYEILPGHSRRFDQLWWFGDDEDVPPFLKAAVVPTGLLVNGILPEADWYAWDDRFRTEANGLPCRTVS